MSRKKQSVTFKRVEQTQLDDHDNSSTKQQQEFKAPLVWTNIILFVILHSALPIGAYIIYTQRPWKTLLWSLFGVYISVLGVTAGTHRLWSHRSYKARWPVQVLLMVLQTMAGQNSIYTWSRDHRVHHKYSETNADPHNIKRGFFFAHMGWLCCKKHPDVKTKGALIDMSDLEANPIVMFQHRHFWWLAIVFTVLVPTLIPVVLWQERFWTSFVISFMWRYIISLHGTWLVNSAAHYHGQRPYDERIEARESPVVIWTAVGEGFHNYHHTFPFDYSTSEFGSYLNITTVFIDLCALVGLAYDLRKMDRDTIWRRRLRTGDRGGKQMKSERINEERGEHNQIDDDNNDDGIELVAKAKLVDTELVNGGQEFKMQYTF
jgi:stearoyl-CoA desaturase (delta-9 desaturase)